MSVTFAQNISKADVTVLGLYAIENGAPIGSAGLANGIPAEVVELSNSSKVSRLELQHPPTLNK